MTNYSELASNAHKRFGVLLHEPCEVSGLTQGKLARKAKFECSQLIKDGSLKLGDLIGLMEQPAISSASGKAAVTPGGDVYPCMFSRWLPVGNVLTSPLTSILAADTMTRTRQQFVATFQQRRDCNPDDCEPYDCSPDISPGCNPTQLCIPDYKSSMPPCEPNKCNPQALRTRKAGLRGRR